MIFIIILLVVSVIFIVKILLNNAELKNIFNDHNVIVFGAKGKGKDLLFQKVIAMNKSKPYLSNIDYGFRYNCVKVADLSVAPNTYENFINNNIESIDKQIMKEGVNVYLSDCGIYLPSQYDSLLSKRFPSFPIYYALSRQLYNQNIHLNTQALNRVWVKLREQADYYIQCLGVKKSLFGLKIKVRYYSKYESALSNQLPMKKSLLNRFNNALHEQYVATYGDIIDRRIYISKKSIHYNTRIFEKFLFDIKRKKVIKDVEHN